MLSGNK